MVSIVKLQFVGKKKNIIAGISECDKDLHLIIATRNF